MGWRTTVLVIAGVFVVRVASAMAFQTLNILHMTGYVPEKFGIAQGYYAEGACQTVLSYQGAFAFELDDLTLDAIAARGLAYFDDVGPPRDSSRGRGIYFQDWAETPVPWSDPPYDLDCAQRFARSWPAGLVDALKEPGSYYSQAGNRFAYVVPSLGLIVITPNTR